MYCIHNNRLGTKQLIRQILRTGENHLSVFFFCVFYAFWLSACSTVDSRPFTKYNAAANEITAIDAAVDAHTSIVREQEMDRISKDRNAIKELALQFDDTDPFKYKFKITSEKEPEPLFIKWQRLDAGLTDLNTTFIEYTRLLATLAGGELINKKDFEKLAADLNGNARSALASLGREVNSSELALFSEAAATAAYAYIGNKRKQYLIDIVTSNQDSVDKFTDFAREIVEVLAFDIRDTYLNTYRSLLTEWVASSSERKREVADKIYTSSEITGKTLDMLKSMDKTYKSLADTHKKLAAGLESGYFSVSDLIADIKRLQKLYKDLKKASADAEKAAAQTSQGA